MRVGEEKEGGIGKRLDLECGSDRLSSCLRPRIR